MVISQSLTHTAPPPSWFPRKEHVTPCGMSGAGKKGGAGDASSKAEASAHPFNPSTYSHRGVIKRVLPPPQSFD